MKVFVVTMQRWGDKESHNYVQGVFTTLEDAELCGRAEKAWRGGKYEANITECILNHQDIDTLAWLEACT